MSDVNYWQTSEGISERLTMLAEHIEWSTFNNAVKVYSTAVGVTEYDIAGQLKKGSCPWCIDHIGRVYRLGQFMPILPRHIGCEHYYSPKRVGPLPQGVTQL
jgi:hypothetical protein